MENKKSRQKLRANAQFSTRCLCLSIKLFEKEVENALYHVERESKLTRLELESLQSNPVHYLSTTPRIGCAPLMTAADRIGYADLHVRPIVQSARSSMRTLKSKVFQTNASLFHLQRSNTADLPDELAAVTQSNALYLDSDDRNLCSIDRDYHKERLQRRRTLLKSAPAPTTVSSSWCVDIDKFYTPTSRALSTRQQQRIQSGPLQATEFAAVGTRQTQMNSGTTRRSSRLSTSHADSNVGLPVKKYNPYLLTVADTSVKSPNLSRDFSIKC